MVGRMNEGTGAEIIQFPRRLQLPVNVTARLGRAVRALEQANGERLNLPDYAIT